jgi:hypothetical protein
MTLVRIGALRSRSNDADFTALTQLLDLSDLRINVLDIRNLIRVGTVQQSCNSPFERGDSVRKIVPARPQRGSEKRISRVGTIEHARLLFFAGYVLINDPDNAIEITDQGACLYRLL